MANKSRPFVGKKNPSPEPLNEVCPHQHFKSDVIDRDFLSRKQHLNLLCTPKGYRWMIKKTNRSAMKSPSEVAYPCKLSKKKPGQKYVHDILAEIWDLITPEMAQRLKEMLMKEFGLSEEAALDFMCHTRYDTTLMACPNERNKQDGVTCTDDRPPEGSTIGYLAAARKLCKSDFNIGINPYHVKEFSKAVSSKVSKYVAAMACAKRNAKHRTMAEVILKGLCDLTGEQTTLDDPKNRLHKILTFTSDRLAFLMVDNMEDEGKRRANRRKREDRALKKKRLARAREQQKRQNEREKMYKEMKKHETRKAEEEAEKKKMEDEEKERKKAEKDKRHQELEKFREEEKQRQKEEIQKAKGQPAANSYGGQASSQSRRDQSGDRPKGAESTRTGQNYKPGSNQGIKTDGTSGSKSKPTTNTQSRRTDRTSGPKGQPVTNNQSRKTNEISSDRARSQPTSQPGALDSNAPKNTLAPGNEKPTQSQQEVKTPKIQDDGPANKANPEDLQQEISKASQLSTPKSVVWGPDDHLKNVASAFSASGKLTPTSSKSSSVDKLVEILSSQGRVRSKIPPKSKSEASMAAVDHQDRLPNVHSSQGILAKVTSSHGKIASEHSSQHLKYGTVSASEDKLGTSHREDESILKVKKTASAGYEVNRTSYAEARQKIGALKKKNSAQILPPTVPFDPHDPKSWEQWVEYASQLAEDWGRWIDKTIQDTEDKAILYQAKAREGKTDPQDVEDWNRFVERTNEDARRWRRQRKAMLDAANDWKK